MIGMEHEAHSVISAPHTGFGYEPHTSAKFGIYQDSSGNTPVWQGGVELNELDILNSHKVAIQRSGRSPYILTVDVWFPSKGEHAKAEQLLGHSATLWYRYGITQHLIGEYMETISGVPYAVQTDTTLLSMTEIVIDPEGGLEARLRFQRLYRDEDT